MSPAKMTRCCPPVTNRGEYTVETGASLHLGLIPLPKVVFLVLCLCLAACGPHASGEEADTVGGGVRTLYLIRHGQYDHEDVGDPVDGPGLVPLGVAQARLVAARLRAMPVEMTSLHSSTMTRARQTALVIQADLSELELQQSDLLRECTPPTWREDVMAEVVPEKAAECAEHLERAIAEYFVPSPDRGRHDIIVCHGNVIRYFVTKILGVDLKSWLGMSIGNCSLTGVRIKPNGTMTLLSFNDVGHLPPNLQTHTGLDNAGRYLAVPGD
jgi:serine/threonine-protein phosphatase PGAM5